MTATVDSRTGGRKKKNRVHQRQARAQHGAAGRGHSGPRVPPLPQILDQGVACAILSLVRRHQHFSTARQQQQQCGMGVRLAVVDRVRLNSSTVSLVKAQPHPPTLLDTWFWLFREPCEQNTTAQQSKLFSSGVADSNSNSNSRLSSRQSKLAARSDRS